MRMAIVTWVTGAFLAWPALAATYVVNPDGTGDFPTIQAAVDAAVNGDIIELGNGIFRGDGNRDVSYLGKAITIRSQGGPEACIIDCEGSATNPHRAFSFAWPEGSGSMLEGVTVTNGWCNFGSAIYCDASSPIISHCVFIANGPGQSPVEGGALMSDLASPHVSDCFFLDNAASYGGAVSVCTSLQPTVFTRCTFAGNVANTGGGMRL